MQSGHLTDSFQFNYYTAVDQQIQTIAYPHIVAAVFERERLLAFHLKTALTQFEIQAA